LRFPALLIHLPGKRGVFALTNDHVVGQAPANQITVNLADSRIVKPARVWTDPESDVALLGLADETLPTATLGDSDRMRVGQFVLAFGSPFGLNQTVTHGIISARERGQVSLGATIRIKDFLQTDAAINPGSSGGPLVNLDEEACLMNACHLLVPTVRCPYNHEDPPPQHSMPIDVDQGAAVADLFTCTPASRLASWRSRC
jgi:hypothetical protein